MSNFTFSIIKELKHQGICDASASIPLGQDQFIVGNDEVDQKLGNILRVYDAHKDGNSLNTIDINMYFPNLPNNPNDRDEDEIDLEAVSELKGVIYWITSHGRSKKGKLKKVRHQFFATQMTDDGSILKQVGKSYTQLVLRDMLEDPQLTQLNLAAAEKIAPKEAGGLNIEGLTVTPEGDLLIGFRNPIRDGKAILIPFKNPQDVIQENQDIKAEFGDPILLDLGKDLGIRSIEYWSVIDAYLIIAGPFDGSEGFALYTWSGKKEEQPSRISIDFLDDFRPESILFYPHLTDQFQILSDDGAVKRVDGQECKEIPSDNPDKFFRSVWVKINKLSAEVKE